jgi:hypothetical protein
MQHILFSIISAIIGINILVVSARQETNQTPEFEHYDGESIVDINATPYLYKEAAPTESKTISMESEVEEASIEPRISETVLSVTPIVIESTTPPITGTLTPTSSPTGTPVAVSGSPTPTPSVTISSVTPTPTATPLVN